MPRTSSKHAESPRGGSAKRRDGVSGAAAKLSQRERLLGSMARVVEREGYAAASVAKVIAGAGVGRVTFYDEFADKEDCFLASYDGLAQRVVGQMRRAARGQERDAVLRAALGSLLGTLEVEPEAGWGVLFEPLGGGPELRARTRHHVVEVSGALERFLVDVPVGAARLEIPALALIGGVRQVVARRLRRVEHDVLPTLADDLLAWVEAYAVPAGSASLSAFLGDRSFGRLRERGSSVDGRARAAMARAGASQAAAAQRLPRGRRKHRESFVNRQLRQRILGATAEMAMLKGYTEMTVADIVACAGIGRDVFYVHFRDKQDAFLAAQQHNLQDHLSACAASFFAAPTWPERIWRGLQTVTEIIAGDPALAHLWLVESFAAGPAAIQHAEEMMVICTLYLQEGYHYREQAADLPQLCSEAIVGALYEIVYHEIDEGRGVRVGELLPELAYIAIAPFTGVQEAAELIDGYMRASP
jgi:AcrR family transcriptional regulator